MSVPDDDLGSDRSRRRESWALPWTVVAWGCALATVTGRDGTSTWIFVRMALIGLLSASLLRAVQRGGRIGATAAIIAGTVGVVVGGGIGISHVLRAGDVVLALAGMVALAAGLSLIVCGAVMALRRRGKWGRAVGTLGITLLTCLVALTFIPSVMATNVPATELDRDTPATFGLSFDDVRFETSDGAALSAWYIPSRNGAAVVVRHGSGSTRSDVLSQAVVLAHHGYGVLVVDARGHGRSGGRAMDFGWFGNADISASVDFLSDQRDVDSTRIGVVGMSMGGEEAIGAAGSDPRVRAVVAEGATGRTDADTRWLADAYGFRGAVQQGIEWLRFTLVDALTSAPKPTSLHDSIEGAASTPFLLIAAGDLADEQRVARDLEASNSGNVSVWVVPNAGHTQGLAVAPAEWEDRVIAFLDQHLAASAS